MSAPGALAISKILYPELQKSRFRGVNAKQPDKLDASNVVEAASMGASQAIPLGSVSLLLRTNQKIRNFPEIDKSCQYCCHADSFYLFYWMVESISGLAWWMCRSRYEKYTRLEIAGHDLRLKTNFQTTGLSTFFSLTFSTLLFTLWAYQLMKCSYPQNWSVKRHFSTSL